MESKRIKRLESRLGRCMSARWRGNVARCATMASLVGMAACSGGSGGGGAEATASSKEAVTATTSGLVSNPGSLLVAPSLVTPIVEGANATGALPGSGSVTPTGAFTYDMPLDVPAGVAGLSPKLSLHYQSNAGNGSLGRGWSLAGGASSIEACNKTVATEGAADGVGFNGSDSYCLDGAKLVQLPGGTSVQTEFYTENDSTTYVVAEAYAPNPPVGFTVYLPNGRIRSYTAYSATRTTSAGTAATVTPSWVLTSESDRAGNSMTYNYTEFGTGGASEYLLTSIDYTQTLAAAPQRSVVFTYAAKSGADASTYYRNGIVRSSTRQLSTIQMMAPNPTAKQTVWTYRLAYGAGQLGHSLLYGVTKAGWLGGTSLTKTFGWMNNNPVAMTMGAAATIDGPSKGYTVTTLTADFNGDGFDDLLTGSDSPSQPCVDARIYWGSAKGFSAPDTTQTNLIGVWLSQSRVIDFTGSGTAGLLALMPNPNGVNISQNCDWYDVTAAECNEYVPIYPSGGYPPSGGPGGLWGMGTMASTGAPGLVMADTFASGTSPITVADMNGDGLVDIVAASSYVESSGTYAQRGGSSETWRVFLSNGDGSFQAPIVAPVAQPSGNVASGQACGNTLVSDFDGNGRTDVMVPTEPDCSGGAAMTLDAGALHFRGGFPLRISGGPNEPTGTVMLSARLADLNGDGLKDVLYLGSNEVAGATSTNLVSYSQMAWNKGNFLFARQGLDATLGANFQTPAVMTWGDAPVGIADVNRDGRDDVVLAAWNSEARPPAFAMLVFQSAGNGTFTTPGELAATVAVPPPSPGATPVYYPQDPTAYPPPSIEMGDYDGDGKTDLLAQVLTTAVPLLASQSQDADLLQLVTEGAGYPVRLGVTYGRNNPNEVTPVTGTATGTTSPACAFPEVCIMHGLPVVTSLSGLDMQNGTTYYRFEGARADLQGRGSLGFATMREWSPARPVERVTTFDNATSRSFTIAQQNPARSVQSHAYPYAMRPKTVLTAVPIETHTASWLATAPYVCGGGASGLPTTATARLTLTTNTYAWQPTNSSNTSWFTYRNSDDTQTWEGSVGIDWNCSRAAHVTGVALPSASAPALRVHLGSYTEDVYQNVTDDLQTTGFGVTSETQTQYIAPTTANYGTWLTGLAKQIQRRSYTPPLLLLTGGTYTPPAWDVTQVTWDIANRGLPTQVVREPGGTADVAETITYGYDESGRLLQKQATTANEQPRTTTYTYGDSSGEGVYPATSTDGQGIKTYIWTHPAYGTPWAVEDANGVSTQFVHDDLGREREVLPASGMNQSHYYLPYWDGTTQGTVVISSRADGWEKVDFVDLNGSPFETVASTFDGNLAQTFTRDAFRRLVATTNPVVSGTASPPTATQEYDSLDRLLVATAADGSTHKYAYTYYTTTATDPMGVVSTVTRDHDGRVVSSTQGTGSTAVSMNYSYGIDDNVATMTDPNGNVSSFRYDVRGRRIGSTTPDDGTRSYLLNGYGELHQLSTTTGTQVYTRDADGRPTAVVTSDGTATYTWDAASWGAGKLVSSTSPDGTTVSYTFDASGRVSTKSFSWGSTAETFTTTYDSLGRLGTLAYPGAPGLSPFTVTYKYGNAYGYLTELDATNVAGATSPVWTVTDRGPTGKLQGATYGNGLVDTRTYDPNMYRLTSAITAAPSTYPGVVNKSYQDWADGRVELVNDNVNQRTDYFQYDGVDRLSYWLVETPGVYRGTSYAYDNIGNPTTVTTNGAVTDTSVYGGTAGAPHAVSSHDGVTYQYDARGRQTGSSAGLTIAYTDFDLPRSVTSPNGESTYFLYTASGDRVFKIGSVATMTLDGLYEKRYGAGTSGGNVHVFYVSGPDGKVAQVEYDDGTSAMTREYLHSDDMGSVGVVTNSAGAVVGSYFHDPFGKRTDVNGNAIATAPTDMHQAFAGHEYDDDLGYVDMKGRIYDPALRRFLTPDPIVSDVHNVQAFNRYGYVRNDPVNAVDPSGYKDIADPSLDDEGGGGDEGGDGSVDDGDDEGDDTGSDSSDGPITVNQSENNQQADGAGSAETSSTNYSQVQSLFDQTGETSGASDSPDDLQTLTRDSTTDTEPSDEDDSVGKTDPGLLGASFGNRNAGSWDDPMGGSDSNTIGYLATPEFAAQMQGVADAMGQLSAELQSLQDLSTQLSGMSLSDLLATQGISSTPPTPASLVQGFFSAVADFVVTLFTNPAQALAQLEQFPQTIQQSAQQSMWQVAALTPSTATNWAAGLAGGPLGQGASEGIQSGLGLFGISLPSSFVPPRRSAPIGD